jgi:hypothetical protein
VLPVVTGTVVAIKRHGWMLADGSAPMHVANQTDDVSS